MMRLDGRIALVTGASRGIGAAVARRFAAEGAQVVATGRTTGALEELDDAIRSDSGGAASATLVPLDLRHGEEIDKLAPALLERFGRLDVLVGNAGVLGTLGPVGDLPPKVWDEVMAVNLTANWRLIRALGPLLLLSQAGRAMFVTSGAARGMRPYWGAYAASKAALESLVLAWAGETAKTKLRVNLVDPGRVRTRMRAEAYPGEDPETLPPPEAITEAFVYLAEPACPWHGETVAATAG